MMKEDGKEGTAAIASEDGHSVLIMAEQMERIAFVDDRKGGEYNVLS